jgi:hypothetical protein
MTRNEGILRTALYTKSEAQLWEHTKEEWYWKDVKYITETVSKYNCVCSKKNIHEVCFIKNKITEKEAIVGNCCVKKFLGIKNPDIFFKTIKNITTNLNGKMSKKFLEFKNVYEIYNQNELDFLNDIASKNKLTLRQQMYKLSLHNRFFKKYLNKLNLLSELKIKYIINKKPSNTWLIESIYTHLKNKHFISHKQIIIINDTFNNLLNN